MAKSQENQTKELSEDEVFSNDLDPLEAINQLRREEGVPEEELLVTDDDGSLVTDPIEDGTDELDELGDPDKEDDTAAADEEGTNDIDPNEDDTDTDTDDADDSNEDESASNKQEEAKVHKFSANGQDFEFTEAEMVEQFAGIFGKAADYTNKTKALAPYRKMVSALESEDISTEQLNLAIDAIKGNKEAMQELMKRSDIDVMDIDPDAEGAYQHKDFGKTDVQMNIEEVTKNISSDAEYSTTVNVIDQQWDDESRGALSSNPEMIQGLHNDIKSGMYDKVAPIAAKMQVTDRNAKSSLEYYMIAGQQVLEAEQKSAAAEQSVEAKGKEAQDVDKEFEEASSEADRTRSSSSTRQRSDRKGVVDYLNDDDDEGYDAWRKKLDASM